MEPGRRSAHKNTRAARTAGRAKRANARRHQAASAADKSDVKPPEDHQMVSGAGMHTKETIETGSDEGASVRLWRPIEHRLVVYLLMFTWKETQYEA